MESIQKEVRAKLDEFCKKSRGNLEEVVRSIDDHPGTRNHIPELLSIIANYITGICMIPHLFPREIRDDHVSLVLSAIPKIIQQDNLKEETKND